VIPEAFITDSTEKRSELAIGIFIAVEILSPAKTGNSLIAARSEIGCLPTIMRNE